MRPARLLTLALLLPWLAGCVEWLFFYNPNHQRYATPADQGLAYESLTFASLDGTPLHAWFVPARGAAKGTVIHFHGNTKNISGHFRYVSWLPERGYNVFLFDYRGYGESGGSPEPQGIHEDGLAALAYVRQRPGVDPAKLLVFGQSLGGNYALAAVADSADRGIRAVCVEGAFASHRAIARDKIARYPLPQTIADLLVDLLVGERHDAETAVRRLTGTRLLLIHGSADDVVDHRHGEILFSRAAGDKTMWTVPDGRHLDTFVYRPRPYRDMLTDFFDAAVSDIPNEHTDAHRQAMRTR